MTAVPAGGNGVYVPASRSMARSGSNAQDGKMIENERHRLNNIHRSDRGVGSMGNNR